MTTPNYTDADVDVAAEGIAREWGYDNLAEVDSVPDTEGVQARASARAALDALAAARSEIPGFAWAYTVTFDGDTHWLECDYCALPVKPVEAGDSLESIVTRARDHDRACSRVKP